MLQIEKKLRKEKSELSDKLSKYQKEKRDLEHCKGEVDKIFKKNITRWNQQIK